MKVSNKFKGKVVLAAFLGLALLPGGAWGQSLKTVAIPEPPDLDNYVRDRAVAVQLGKALFWDMQVGSDGITACASCHFHAGADNRTQAQLNPNTLGGDSTFQVAGRNSKLKASYFPFVKFVNPHDPSQGLVHDWNDVVSSQGVRLKKFVDIVPGVAEDLGTDLKDPIWKTNRRVEPRNTPTVINSVFNFAQFWDGRANNVFNGQNPFGAMDTNSTNGNPIPRLVQNVSGSLVRKAIRMRNASLASQAMGPPLSDFEMSWQGRTWPKVGKKMISLNPLAKQIVHPQDSVLGMLSNSTLVNFVPTDVKGINTTYENMIKQAFQRSWWNNTTQIVKFNRAGVPQIEPHPGRALTTDEYTQMEANFSFFFGLAVQMYEASLIADNTPFDRFQEGFLNALTTQQQFGMQIFQGVGQCTVCHVGPEMTGIAVNNLLAQPNPVPGVPLPAPDPSLNPPNAIELMPFAVGDALYDIDFLNISIVRTSNDPGRDGNTPFINPLTGVEYPFCWSKLAKMKRDGLLPPSVAKFTPNLPDGFLPGDTSPTADRQVSTGAMKVPHLRNVNLTGPYFHAGSVVTLMQLMDFYSRGGNFRERYFPPADCTESEIPPEISIVGFLRGNDTNQKAIISFLEGLTDPRVPEERGPFDHPELFIPHGIDAAGADIIERIPPVGIGGRIPAGLPLLQPFLGVNQFTP